MRLSAQTPEYLSKEAAARLAGLPDANRVARHVAPDAWKIGPNGKRWPLYKAETIERWVAENSITIGPFKRGGPARDGRVRRSGGEL